MTEKLVRIDRYRGTELIGTKTVPLEQKTRSQPFMATPPGPPEVEEFGVLDAAIYVTVVLIVSIIAVASVPSLRDLIASAFGWI